jgi:glyoxylase-like metal-dependent hydrolase (beta-lactamase superfamily II)
MSKELRREPVTGEDSWRSWPETGPQEVVPGIFRIPLSLHMDELKAVNVYAVVSVGGVTLIDAGWAFQEGEKELAIGLATAGLDLADVTDFLITHAHRDHYTLAVAVRRRLGTRIRVGLPEQANLRSLAERGPHEEIRQAGLLCLAGAPELAYRMRHMDNPYDKSDWELPDAYVEDHALLDLGSRRLRAIHTPGHTRGHFIFHDEAKAILFTGDHVLPHITPSIAFEELPPSAPLSDYIASLQMVRGLPDALLLPGHGPVGTSVHERVDELLEHHDARLEHTLAAVKQGADTALEVARQLTWTSRQRHLSELDDFNSMLAILETYWHLEVLSERDAVSRSEEPDGPVHYSSDRQRVVDDTDPH